MKARTWQGLLAFILGAALGLLYSWIISPVSYVNTSPNTLRPDFKDQVRASIAAAYAGTGNLERARARLALLGDVDMAGALNAQAQRMLAAGDSPISVQHVVDLAGNLQLQAPVGSPTAFVYVPSARLTATASPRAGPSPDMTQTNIPQQTIEPPPTISTPTRPPTRTPTPSAGAPFELFSRETLCDAGLQQGLIQVIVTDFHRHQLAGAEIIVAWDSGEEHFFTGLKPELGDGYADYAAQSGVTYSVRIASGGAAVTGLTPPTCSADQAAPFTGQIKLTFQQK